jgi:hypothetical protein
MEIVLGPGTQFILRYEPKLINEKSYDGAFVDRSENRLYSICGHLPNTFSIPIPKNIEKIKLNLTHCEQETLDLFVRVNVWVNDFIFWVILGNNIDLASINVWEVTCSSDSLLGVTNLIRLHLTDDTYIDTFVEKNSHALKKLGFLCVPTLSNIWKKACPNLIAVRIHGPCVDASILPPKLERLSVETVFDPSILSHLPIQTLVLGYLYDDMDVIQYQNMGIKKLFIKLADSNTIMLLKELAPMMETDIS